jgi:hypothetical protein
MTRVFRRELLVVSAVIALAACAKSTDPTTQPTSPEGKAAKYGTMVMQTVQDIQRGLEAAKCTGANQPCLDETRHATAMGATVKAGETGKQLAGYLRTYDTVTNTDAAALERLKALVGAFDTEIKNVLSVINNTAVQGEVRAAIDAALNLITTIRSEFNLGAQGEWRLPQGEVAMAVVPVAGFINLINLLLPIAIGAYRRIRDEGGAGTGEMLSDAELINQFEQSADEVIAYGLNSLSQTEAGRKWLAENGYLQTPPQEG